MARLLWLDVPDGAIHTWQRDSGHEQLAKFGDRLSFLIARDDGGFLAGRGTTVTALDQRAHPVGFDFVGPSKLGSRSKLNDAAADPFGCLLFGTVARGTRGALWRLHHSGRPETLLDNVGMANGIACSPDGQELYFVDSERRHVLAMTYAPDRPVENTRVLIEFDKSDGLPDGLCVDEEGALWVALWGGSRVVRLTQTGRKVDEHGLPVSKVSSCAFGGESLEELFVTSAWTEGEPLSGRTFRIHPGVRGLLPHKATI